MNFDDVAVGVVEENLAPTFDRPVAVIGIGNALLLQAFLECRHVVGAESDVAFFKWIDDLPGAEADAEIFFGKVHLGGAIGYEGNFAVVAICCRGAGCLHRRFAIEVEDGAIEFVQRRDIVRAQVDVVQLDLHRGLALRAIGRFGQ